MRQFIACKFNPADRRSYTYSNDGEPVAVGDMVKVAARGEGWNKVHVVAIYDAEPVVDFKIAGILGKVEPEAPVQRDMLDDGDDRDLEASREDRA